MQLPTLQLSDDFRKRLEIALPHVQEKYEESKDPQLLLRAFSAAIWGDEAACNDFGLAPLTKVQTKESVALASALIGMADATHSPALILENLPTDETLNKLCLIGLGLSIDSGLVNDTNKYPNKGIHLLTHNRKDPDHNIYLHEKFPLHSDTASAAIPPTMRILGGSVVGSHPLPTKVALVSEMIDKAAHILVEGRHDKFKDAIPPEWDNNTIRKELIRALEAPLWAPSPLTYAKDTHDSTDLYSNAVIFTNPHTDKEAPAYGLYRSPNELERIYSNHRSMVEKQLHTLHMSDAFVDAVKVATINSMFALKKDAAGTILQPGQALLWNDRFVVHGTGFMQTPERSWKNLFGLSQSKPTERRLSSLSAMVEEPPKETAMFPGAHHLHAKWTVKEETKDAPSTGHTR